MRYKPRFYRWFSCSLTRYCSVIVLEDLDKLRESNKKSRVFNKKLGLWFYRRTQFCIEYEAKERSLRVVKVSPRETSSKCHRCGKKLVENGHRVLRCRKCNFIGDIDVTAILNLYKKYVKKYLRCGVSGVALKAPSPMKIQKVLRGIEMKRQS
jgi:IS605 OrfB family transposase